MKNFIKYFFLFLFIFFLGILTERFEIDNKISSNFRNVIDSSSRFFYSLKSNEKLEIIIDQKEFIKLSKTRERALKKGMLQDDMQKWATAKLKDENITRNIKIRLKGAFPDHWSDDNRWSFKVKVTDDSKLFNNLYRFNLQTPETSSFIYEWLLMKALEKEELITLGVKYYDLIINGKNIGAYMLQGGISEEILKLNNKAPGPIIGFSNDWWLKSLPNEKRLDKLGATGSLNGIEDVFWRTKIEPVQFADKNIGTIQEAYLKKSIYLLESFRNGTKKPSEVFDTNKLAKVMALRALLGSSEFDYKDTKFYFNPESSLLEPITKESHVDLNLNFKDHYVSWWINSSDIRPHRPGNKDFFLDILYNDYKFYRTYIVELNRLSKKNYYQSLINENKKEFNKYLKIQNFNYPTKKVFSSEHLEINRARIQDFLNPVQGLNVYFLEYNDNMLKLDVSNLQRLPVEIFGLEFKSGYKIFLKNPIFIQGKKPQLPVKHNIIKFDCSSNEECKKLLINNQKVTFKVFGQKKEKKASISMFYPKS